MENKFRLLGSIISIDELMIIKNKIREKFQISENFHIASHVFDNYKKRIKKVSRERMSVKELLGATLGDYSIIEVHNLKGTVRVLVRSKNMFGEANSCFVLDLDKRSVITCYFNKSDDNHSTIDMSCYFGKFYA